MADYHINEDGNVGTCRASKKPCPFGDWSNHYQSKEAAMEGYEKYQELLALTSSKSVSEYGVNYATEQAVNSSLHYQGKSPKWIKKMSKASSDLFNSEPEIIDSIFLDGNNYAVVWNKNSLESVDIPSQLSRGYRISSIEFRDMKTGKEAGRLKINLVDEESMELSFGNDEFSDLRAYQDRDGGSYFLDLDSKQRSKNAYLSFPAPYNEKTIDNTRIDEKKKLWARIHNGLDIVPENFDKEILRNNRTRQLSEEYAPDDEKTLDEHLDSARETIRLENDNFVKSYAIPFVDNSKLEKNLRGKGLGVSMYVYASRMLAREGKVLTASNLQTPEAKSLWKRMAKDPQLKVSIVSLRHKNKKYSKTSPALALDFLKNSNS